MRVCVPVYVKLYPACILSLVAGCKTRKGFNVADIQSKAFATDCTFFYCNSNLQAVEVD